MNSTRKGVCNQCTSKTTTAWSVFSSSLNSWKETPKFEQLWNACNQEEVIISLVSNKENEEEKVSNSYFAHHKNKGSLNKFKGPRRKVYLSKTEFYNCHKMGHYRSNCPKNLRRDTDQANISNEGSPKKKNMEGSKVSLEIVLRGSPHHFSNISYSLYYPFIYLVSFSYLNLFVLDDNNFSFIFSLFRKSLLICSRDMEKIYWN